MVVGVVEPCLFACMYICMSPMIPIIRSLLPNSTLHAMLLINYVNVYARRDLIICSNTLLIAAGTFAE